jgi:hypothetical protein
MDLNFSDVCKQHNARMLSKYKILLPADEHCDAVDELVTVSVGNGCLT